MRKALITASALVFVISLFLCTACPADDTGTLNVAPGANKKIAGGTSAFASVSAIGSDTAKKETATSAAIETVEATDQNGNKVTVKLSEVDGLTSDWLKAAGYDAAKNTVKVDLDDNGKVKTLSIYDKESNLLSRYDKSSRLMEYYHTTGTLKGKLDYVTSESTRKSTWRDPAAKDPGKGKDGHVIVQKFNYDASGQITTVDYFAWTAGNRKKTEDEKKFSRYMYRQDTYKDGKLEKTNYFNDPRPTFWEPTITGKITKDNQGRIFLTDSAGKSYLLTARKDGFDVDGDGKVGADEMSGVNWESYVGKEITVRGHQIAEENENDVYFNGKKAEAFGVVDVIQTDKGEKIAEGWDTTGAKVTEVMDKFFILVGDEKDVGKVYDKIYGQLVKDLKKAGISDADIEKFADTAMKDKWKKDTTKVTDFTKYTDSAALIKEAWKYYNNKDWENARAFSEETMTRYKDTAAKQQASLKDYAAKGKEADYWALNDVGTAAYIIAESYKNEKEYAKAREYYNQIISKYGYAQCWDTQGWYWKVKEAAEKALKEIKDK